MATKLSDDKKGLLFKMLAEKPMYETGVEFGLDKYFKTVSGVRNFVHKVYNEVRQNPELFGIHPDSVSMVVSIVDNRSPIGKGGQVSLREKKEFDDTKDIKDHVLEGRKKAYKLLNLKMDDIMSSKKKVADANIATLAQVFGILFDKGQIVKGEATEHIAMLGKIEGNLTPQQMMDMVLKTREGNIEEKTEEKKK